MNQTKTYPKSGICHINDWRDVRSYFSAIYGPKFEFELHNAYIHHLKYKILSQ